MRAALLVLLVLLGACGGDEVDERTYLCGSYEPVGEGSTASEPPC